MIKNKKNQAFRKSFFPRRNRSGPLPALRLDLPWRILGTQIAKEQSTQFFKPLLSIITTFASRRDRFGTLSGTGTSYKGVSVCETQYFAPGFPVCEKNGKNQGKRRVFGTILGTGGQQTNRLLAYFSCLGAPLGSSWPEDPPKSPKHPMWIDFWSNNGPKTDPTIKVFLDNVIQNYSFWSTCTFGFYFCESRRYRGKRRSTCKNPLDF